MFCLFHLRYVFGSLPGIGAYDKPNHAFDIIPPFG